MLLETELLSLLSKEFLTSSHLMLGGSLLETENKSICQPSGLKTGRRRLRNLSSGHLQESSQNSICLRNKILIYKVVANRRWSFTRSGCHERVDCISESLVINCENEMNSPFGWKVFLLILHL